MNIANPESITAAVVEARVLKQPHPAPRLPVFLVEKWHKVHGGLHLTFLSLICSLLALLPVVAIGIAMGLGVGASRVYSNQWSPRFNGDYEFSMTWLAFAAAVAIAGVCVVFCFLGQAMCCAAPLSSGAKRWIIYSLFLSLLLVMPGAAICIAGFSRIEPGSHGVFALTAVQLRYSVSYPFLGLMIVSTMAHILFVIGLLQINRVFGNRTVINLAMMCLAADLVSLAFDAVLFLLFVVRETTVRRGHGDAGTEDRVMAAFLLGIPALLSLMLFVMFLFLIQKTRDVVAQALADRTGLRYLLK